MGLHDPGLGRIAETQRGVVDVPDAGLSSGINGGKVVSLTTFTGRGIVVVHGDAGGGHQEQLVASLECIFQRFGLVEVVVANGAALAAV
jgi:hypothetical protein